jgi:Peptidase family M28
MIRRRVTRVLLLSAALSWTVACGRPIPRFSTENARAHVEMLAGTIGSRPIGSVANARARQYIVDQLRLYGFEVRVQETDARRSDLGLTARVANIIAVRAGADRSAIGLFSHYDSAPESPGGGDDGFGVGVSLEAARVLAARADRRHSLLVLVTDGEEAGLMGAAGLVADREVMSRLSAYVNVEATGSSGTAVLFETGPRNAWILKPWARSAPHPRGASYAFEIYRRLPNDTDFSILKRHEIPGLNFALIGDSYAYHTARDTADRLTDAALRLSGENVVSTIETMDLLDLKVRSTSDPTYFDIGQVAALTWGPVASWFIAVAALALGTLAWFKVLAASVRLVGLLRWILDLVWALVGVAIVASSTIGMTWLLREAREVYHPWYAHPERLFLLLLCTGTLAAWVTTRIGTLLPPRAHAPRHPMLAWSFTLPLWVACAGLMASQVPAAGYLWTLPLLAAALGLLAVPVTNVPAVRIVSVVTLAVAGTLWLRDTVDLLRFVVAVLGRLPIITPVYAFAALMLVSGAMVVPPFIAAIASMKPLFRPAIVTAVLLVAVVIAAGFAYIAPAYTNAQPQRRYARVLIEPGATTATYEVASQEPGVDLQLGAPGGWYRATDAPRASLPLGQFRLPFVFRTEGPLPGPAPATISAFALTPVAAGTELTMTILPQATSLAAAFVLPQGIEPARSNLPGVLSRGRWQAAFISIPPEGITWRASFPRGKEPLLSATRATVMSARFPGGEGWQGLPAWLPQEHAVWNLTVTWILEPPTPIAPVPPLR